MWKCDNDLCGHVYDGRDLPRITESHGDSRQRPEVTEAADCPACGWGALRQAYPCRLCGSAMREDELRRGVCVGCLMREVSEKVTAQRFLAETGREYEFYCEWSRDTRTTDQRTMWAHRDWFWKDMALNRRAYERMLYEYMEESDGWEDFAAWLTAG